MLAVVAHGETIYAGCQDGYVRVWDLETKSLVREIIVQEGVDILSLSMMHSDLYTCSCNGQIQVCSIPCLAYTRIHHLQRWSSSFDCTESWSAHDGIVLSSIITQTQAGAFVLMSGANDGYIKVTLHICLRDMDAERYSPDMGHRAAGAIPVSGQCRRYGCGPVR